MCTSTQRLHTPSGINRQAMSRPRIRITLRLRLAIWIGIAAFLVAATSIVIAPILGGIATLAVAVACSAGGYLLAGVALRPLQEVRVKAQRLSTHNLDERIQLAGPHDELRELSDTFDQMLDRLSESFESQHRFVANASHELRTPLAVMRTEIDVALSNPDEDVAELRQMGEVVRDGCYRANDLIEALLWLARAESEGVQQTSTMVRADLGECAFEAIGDATRLADEIGLSLAVSRSAAPVNGIPSLLARIPGNLIENAIRHNVAGGRLWVLTGSNPTHSWMVVGNTGPVVSPEIVESIFEPFNRGSEARVGRRGAGLGMSIVRAVVFAHGGSLQATALSNGGLEVRVELPTVTAEASEPAD